MLGAGWRAGEAEGGCPASNVRRWDFQNLITRASQEATPVEGRYIRGGIRAVNGTSTVLWANLLITLFTGAPSSVITMFFTKLPAD
jgi:hypothetical protein